MRFGDTRVEFLGGRGGCLTMLVVSILVSVLLNALL